MNKEYIDREALITEFREINCIGCTGSNCRCCWVNSAKGYIKEAPTADVAPVVHGEWEEEHWVGTRRHACWRCTKCKGRQILKYKYCPECGALMDGDK